MSVGPRLRVTTVHWLPRLALLGMRCFEGPPGWIANSPPGEARPPAFSPSHPCAHHRARAAGSGGASHGALMTRVWSTRIHTARAHTRRDHCSGSAQPEPHAPLPVACCAHADRHGHCPMWSQCELADGQLDTDASVAELPLANAGCRAVRTAGWWLGCVAVWCPLSRTVRAFNPFTASIVLTAPLISIWSREPQPDMLITDAQTRPYQPVNA